MIAENRGVATPANWKIGEKVMISAGATPEQASCLNSEYSTVTLPSGKNYIRFCQLPDHTKELEKQSEWKDPMDGKVTSLYDETVRIAQDISFAEYEWLIKKNRMQHAINIQKSDTTEQKSKIY